MDMSTSPLALLNDPSLLKTDALINGEWVAGVSRFVVTNVPGASGSIAHEQVVRAAPDGYTLIVGTASTVPGNAAYNTLKWDPIKDVTPIAMLAVEPMSVIVHPSVPANSVKELIALAKAKPGTLNGVIRIIIQGKSYIAQMDHSFPIPHLTGKICFLEIVTPAMHRFRIIHLRHLGSLFT